MRWPDVRFVRSPGLTARVALGLAAVGLLPLALAAWRLIDLNRDALRNQVLQSHVVAASSAAERVEEFLELRRALARVLASSVALAADARSPAVSSALYGLLEARPDIDAAVVVNAEGGEVVRAQRVSPDPEMQRLLAAPGVTPLTSPPFADPVTDSTASPRWVRIDSPLPEIGGSVRLLCRGAPLEEILDPYALGAQARVSLLRRDGRWVAGSPFPSGALPPGLLEQTRAGALSGARLWRSPGEGEMLAAFDAVDGSDWLVVSRQPAAVAEGVARRMARDALLAVGLALALIAALTAAAWLSVARPLRGLVRVQRRLAGLRGTPGGGSEIDQLKRSFAALERRLRQREELERVFLGRYQVVGVLGEGAMGTVFRGWDPKLRRPLALKTVHLDKALASHDRSEQASRLLGEAVTVAKFSHPNIVSVYDAEDAGEAAFIAMELVDGVTFEQFLWPEKPLPPGQVAHVGAAVARALAEAHAHDVVHHDVKPANVLLARDGAVKVTDFGISQILTDLAHTDAVYGTPGYLPPETLENQTYDFRGDLFGLGAVLYHGLTGQRPFAGKTYREVILRTLEGDVIPPHRLRPEIPEELSRLVMELLARDPSRRPASAAAVAETLQQLAERLAPGWRPSPEPEPDEERSPRHEPHESPPSRLLEPSDLGPRGSGRRRRGA
jgi:serine/threonine-protein kinase